MGLQGTVGVHRWTMYLILLAICLGPVLANYSRPVDLSHFYDSQTVYWPGGQRFNFTQEFTRGSQAQDWYAANDFQTAEHGGTHLDAPYHFNPSNWHVGDIPLERLFGKAVYLNLREEAAKNPDLQIKSDTFIQWESKHGRMPEGAVVLLDFGWTEKYGDPALYFGAKNASDMSTFHFPGLSSEGAQWLANSGRVFGVGTDTASLDYGQSTDYESHRIMAKYNMYILEHLALPKIPLPPLGFRIISLPMKIRKGSGAPCRVMAVFD